MGADLLENALRLRLDGRSADLMRACDLLDAAAGSELDRNTRLCRREVKQLAHELDIRHDRRSDLSEQDKGQAAIEQFAPVSFQRNHVYDDCTLVCAIPRWK
jgi:hypothetical protein